MSNKILIILHQELSTPGRVGRLLRERGFELDIRRPRFGDPLPATMAGHRAAVIFGGPMSANDKEPYIKAEIDWCGVALDEQAPLLGICLGAQMMVKYLGGNVSHHPQGLVEVGYYPLKDIRTDGCSGGQQDIMPPAPSHFYQWHREGFDIPAGARLMMTGNYFENQAFAIGKTAFGVQFHPEVTLAMTYRWLVRGYERTAMPGAQDRKQHLEGRLLYDKAIRLWLEQFLDNWLAADRRFS